MAETAIRLGTTPWSPPRDRRRWSLEVGQEMVHALQASGETAEAFALRHGLHKERVRRWVRRVERRRPASPPPVPPAPAGFAPVRLVARVEADCPPLELAVGTAVVRVRRGFDEALLRQVVAALGGERC